MPATNYLSGGTKQWLYRRSGASEGIEPEALGGVDIEAFRRWMADQYPDRSYPAIGGDSSNGAAVHLAALLGVRGCPRRS